MSMPRRSVRLQRLYDTGKSGVDPPSAEPVVAKNKSFKEEETVPKKQTAENPTRASNTPRETLPRTREFELFQSLPDISFVMGIDEAGRGPLAGPVVAAAILSTCATVNGVCDSKLLTKEPLRDALYQQILSSPNLRYAVAVVDAKTIDEINILQATYEAMRMAASGALGLDTVKYESSLSTSHVGCYVVTGATDENGEAISTTEPLNAKQVFSLIDGNRLPPKFPTEAETMTKGDGREYLIGAASILAKVSRDALMHEYHAQYPHFLLDQHKGYGTAKHMELIVTHGPLPIHRKTFAPIKHMINGSGEREDSNGIGVKDGQKSKRKRST